MNQLRRLGNLYTLDGQLWYRMPPDFTFNLADAIYRLRKTTKGTYGGTMAHADKPRPV